MGALFMLAAAPIWARAKDAMAVQRQFGINNLYY
jgi:hypothetical protein